MIKFKTILSNIAAISPRSIGFLIVVGGWEPIYQLLRIVGFVGSEFNGFFISFGLLLSISVFLFDLFRILKSQKKNKT